MSVDRSFLKIFICAYTFESILVQYVLRHVLFYAHIGTFYVHLNSPLMNQRSLKLYVYGQDTPVPGFEVRSFFFQLQIPIRSVKKISKEKTGDDALKLVWPSPCSSEEIS